jgi:hypothetical protein
MGWLFPRALAQANPSAASDATAATVHNSRAGSSAVHPNTGQRRSHVGGG